MRLLGAEIANDASSRLSVRPPRRVVMKLDEKMTNAATFTLKREDHTLGNLLRTCVVWLVLAPPPG